MFIFTLLVALIFLVRVSWKTEQLKRGRVLPMRGLANRLAHRWHRAAIENGWWDKRRLMDFAPRAKQSEPVPDRTPEQVDAGTKAGRRERRSAPVEPDGRPSRADWIASIDRSDIPEYGTWARFEYVDADGVVTNRHIRRWSKRGAYIEGFCMDRREGRTFRQDRISDWVSG